MRRNKSEKDVQITISVKKSRKVIHIEAVLNSTGIKYTTNISKKGYTTFGIFGEYAREIERWIPEKYLTWEMTTWHREAKQAIIDGYTKTDGHIKKSGCIVMTSANKRNIDILQAIGLSLGYTSSSTKSEPNGISKNVKDWWQLCMFKKTERLINKNNISLVDYIGDVYCVTVPNGYIVVRRNNKPTIVGNCRPSIDYDTSMGDKSIGQHAALHQKGILKTLPLLSKHKAILCGINQRRDNVTAQGKMGTNASGGASWRFYSSYNFIFKKSFLFISIFN
jgi:hypothetical protein